MNRAVFTLVLSFFLATQFVSGSATADERSALSLLPPTTVVYAEIPDPPTLMSVIFDHPLRQKIEALEPYQQATRTEGYRGFLTGRKFVEIQLGMEWREAIETLTARGIYLGVDAATQGVVVLIQGRDAKSMDHFRTKLLELTKLGKNPDQIREGEYRGLAVYDANKSKFAVVEDWLIITNKPETGKVVLDRLLDGATDELSENHAFRSARKQKPADASAWLFVNLETLRNAGVAQKLFAGQAANPGVELLAGGILSTLQQTSYATITLAASQEDVDLKFAVPHQTDWVPEERQFFFGPDGKGRAPALPETNETLFTLSTYRNVSEMWLRAGDLFSAEINDGLAEADANLTTLFAGKDFGEDILGSLTPEIGFIATRQDFSDILPKPAIKLPQFGLVMNLREPETMTRELRRTFQSMIGFFNVLGAMEGRPQLEMDMVRLDDEAQLITSTYIPEEDDVESTRADIIFNFSPSIGFAAERFVVASTAKLAKELVKARKPVQTDNAVNSRANLKAETLRSVLTDNQEQLIAQNMLEEGNTREESQVAISLLLEVIGFFDEATLQLDAADNELVLDFRVTLQN